MKKLILLFMFTFFNLNQAQTCFCGSFVEGIYSYGIEEGSGGCCTGDAIGLGMYDNNAAFITYVRDEGGWVVDDLTLVQPITAQSRCCGESS